MLFWGCSGNGETSRRLQEVFEKNFLEVLSSKISMQLQRDDPSTAHRPGKKFFRTSRSKRKNAENFFGARSLDIAGDNRRPEVIRPRGLGAIETGVAGKPGFGGAGVAMAAGVHRLRRRDAFSERHHPRLPVRLDAGEARCQTGKRVQVRGGANVDINDTMRAHKILIGAEGRQLTYRQVG